jgi:hypothetical protein
LCHVKSSRVGFMRIGPTFGSASQGTYSHKPHPSKFYLTCKKPCTWFGMLNLGVYISIGHVHGFRNARCVNVNRKFTYTSCKCKTFNSH